MCADLVTLKMLPWSQFSSFSKNGAFKSVHIHVCASTCLATTRNRALSCSVPKLWNSLPPDSLLLFKAQLKTHPSNPLFMAIVRRQLGAITAQFSVAWLHYETRADTVGVLGRCVVLHHVGV